MWETEMRKDRQLMVKASGTAMWRDHVPAEMISLGWQVMHTEEGGSVRLRMGYFSHSRKVSHRMTNERRKIEKLEDKLASSRRGDVDGLPTQQHTRRTNHVVSVEREQHRREGFVETNSKMMASDRIRLQ